MSQTTTDKFQMLSRLSHVDEVQYKRWNHYKVHEALNTRVIFRRHLDFFSLGPRFPSRRRGEGSGGGRGLGRHWRGGESVKSFVLFWFFGFYFRMSIMSGTLTFRPFSKRWNYSENFKTINVVLNFTRSVKTRPIINLDCKTVGFFLNVKIRTVLQSIINSHMPTKKSVTLQSLSL